MTKRRSVGGLPHPDRTGPGWWRADTGGIPRWLAPAAVAAVLFAIVFVLLAPQSQLRLGAGPPAQPLGPAGAGSNSPATEGQTVLFIGDSYAAGTGASSSSRRWTSLVSRQAGWLEENRAYGGTGYVASSGPAGCGREFCPPYQQALDGYLADNPPPDLVVVSGGRNDLGKPGVTAAVDRFWKDLCSRNIPMIATSPLWHSTTSPAQLKAIGDRVRAGVTGCGGRYLELGQPLDRSGRLSSDGVHPNNAGHAAIAAAFTKALSRS